MPQITVLVSLGYIQEGRIDKISVEQIAMLKAYEDHEPWKLVRPLKKFIQRDDLPDYTLCNTPGPIVDCIIIERGTESVVRNFSPMPFTSINASVMNMLNALVLPSQLGDQLLAAKA